MATLTNKTSNDATLTNKALNDATLTNKDASSRSARLWDASNTPNKPWGDEDYHPWQDEEMIVGETMTNLEYN